MDYRKSSKEVRDAWFAFKKKHPHSTICVYSFVAGWNAAQEEKEKEEYTLVVPQNCRL